MPLCWGAEAAVPATLPLLGVVLGCAGCSEGKPGAGVGSCQPNKTGGSGGGGWGEKKKEKKYTAPEVVCWAGVQVARRQGWRGGRGERSPSQLTPIVSAQGCPALPPHAAGEELGPRGSPAPLPHPRRPTAGGGCAEALLYFPTPRRLSRAPTSLPARWGEGAFAPWGGCWLWGGGAK